MNRRQLRRALRDLGGNITRDVQKLAHPPGMRQLQRSLGEFNSGVQDLVYRTSGGNFGSGRGTRGGGGGGGGR
jgi:hypothetical protein